MQFRITIDCDNDAFEDAARELRHILKLRVIPNLDSLAYRDNVSGDIIPSAIAIFDSNGNTVGKAEFIDA